MKILKANVLILLFFCLFKDQCCKMPQNVTIYETMTDNNDICG